MSGNTNGIKASVMLEGVKDSVSLSPIKGEFSIRNTTKNLSEEFYHPVSFDLPNEYLQPGVSIKILLDPENKILESNESNNIYPTNGLKTLGYKTVPDFKIKFVPTRANGDNSVMATDANGLTIDNDTHNSLSNYLEAMFPVDNVSSQITNELDLSSLSGQSGGNKQNYSAALDKVEAFRVADPTNDGKTFYYGLWTGGDVSCTSGTLGIAFVGNPNDIANSRLSGIGIIFPEYLNKITAHELGHNHGYNHINSVN